MRQIQIYDGDMISATNVQHFFLECCDCGLVHKVFIRVVDKEAQMEFYRDNRRTSQRKRRKREWVQYDKEHKKKYK